MNFINKFLGDNKCRLTKEAQENAKINLGITDFDSLGIVEYFHFCRYVTITLPEAMKKKLPHFHNTRSIKGLTSATMDDVGNPHVMRAAGVCRNAYILYALDGRKPMVENLSADGSDYLTNVSNPYWWIMKGKARGSYLNAIHKGLLCAAAIQNTRQTQTAFDF
jgi:hypothetical protein